MEDQLAQLHFFQGVAALHSGDAQTSNEIFEDVVTSALPPGPIAGEVQITLALSRNTSGEKQRAYDALNRELNVGQKNHRYLSRIIFGKCFLDFINLEATDALNDAEQLSTLSDEIQSNYLVAWSEYMRGLVLLNTARNHDACDAFNNVIRLQNGVERRVVVDAFLGEALSLQLRGRPDEAQQAMLRLQRWAGSLGDARCSSLASSCSARLSLLLGDLASAAEAIRLVATYPRTGNLLFWQEEPEITAVRVQLATGKRSAVDAAADVLAELGEQVKAQHQRCQLVDILLLQALAQELSGARKVAQELLEQALEIAAPADWSRPFAEVGETMLPLIEAARDRGIEPEFADRLLGRSTESRTEQRPWETVESRPQVSEQTDALTNRELDILELLAQRYRNKEIAAKLFISTHTVNYHLKHIYQKLGVSGRRQAVLKAIETGDLPS
jgi:LuxR family maltose regulon positive regulatory protein